MKNPFKAANEDVNDNIENGTNEEIKTDEDNIAAENSEIEAEENI